MKLKFLSVGKDRSGLFAPAVDDYLERLAHVAKVESIELSASRATGLKGRDEEAAALLGKVGARDVLVALDVTGKPLASVEFARWLARQQDAGRDVAFAIGGDEGLGPGVLERAALVLSLSAMTFPHRLARLVLAEQVYRAFTILRGEPYHK